MKRLAAVLALLPGVAFGQAGTTLCPMVSDNVSLLSVNIVNAPAPVQSAYLDLETNYLFIFYAGQINAMFIGVPRSVVQGPTTQYSSIKGFHQAIMQEKSACPLLAETHSEIGMPIVSQDGLYIVTQTGIPIYSQPTDQPYGPPIWSQP